MQGLIKRNKWSVPFLPKYPKMTPEYKAEMDDLFFGRNISSINQDDYVIALGTPIMIKEEVKTLGNLNFGKLGQGRIPVPAPAADLNLPGDASFISKHFLSFNYNVAPLVICGGVSPAYKKFGPEFIGAAAIEIFKGTFESDFKLPESFRVCLRLAENYDEYGVMPEWLEVRSSNTFDNIKNAWQGLKNKNAHFVIAATIEQLPRAIETFKTVAGESVEVKGLPYNPKVQGKWHKSPWWQSRFAAEVKRMNDYSDPNNDRIKNKIVLSAETAAKLQKISEISR